MVLDTVRSFGGGGTFLTLKIRKVHLGGTIYTRYGVYERNSPEKRSEKDTCVCVLRFSKRQTLFSDLKLTTVTR